MEVKNSHNKNSMKGLSGLLIIIVFIIIIGIIMYFVLTKLTKVEYRFNIQIPSTKREAYLDVSFTYPDFTNSSNSYTFAIYLENQFQNDIPITIDLKIFITSGTNELTIDEKSVSDTLPAGIKKRYDFSFTKVFDNSIISGLNFCEAEKPLIESSSKECYKGESYPNQICWEDCKLYSLDSPERKKNLYCIVSPKILTTILYDATIRGTAEIEQGSKEDRIRWNVREAPLKIYVRPSPLPYNNLLPLDVALEIEGYNVMIKKIKISTINYSIEKETYFEKTIEKVETEEKCEIELNKWINGKIYLSKENGFDCLLNPPNIKIEKIGKETILQELSVKNESKEVVERICKDYKLPDGSIDLQACAQELTKKGYEICSLFSSLEVCKQAEEYTKKLILFIEVEITAKKGYSRTISYLNC